MLVGGRRYFAVNAKIVLNHASVWFISKPACVKGRPASAPRAVRGVFLVIATMLCAATVAENHRLEAVA